MSYHKKAVAPALLLSGFVPFRLNRLAAAVSEKLSEIYRDRFALTIPEWRVLATVHERQDCNAQYIVDSTRMHKTRVSRAIASLMKRGFIERSSTSRDARQLALRLTKAGSRLYGAIMPLILERERLLLSCLNDAQRREFVHGLTRLEEHLGLGAE